VGQELLGLRKAFLALTSPVFSSGIQLTGGGDAKGSQMLFPAGFSLPAVLFVPNTCRTY